MSNKIFDFRGQDFIRYDYKNSIHNGTKTLQVFVLLILQKQ